MIVKILIISIKLTAMIFKLKLRHEVNVGLSSVAEKEEGGERIGGE